MRVSLSTFSCQTSQPASLSPVKTFERSEKEPLVAGFRIFSVVFVCAGSA